MCIIGLGSNMKNRLILAVLLAALACGVYSSSHVRAQGEGFVGLNNIHSMYIRSDFTDANAAGAQNILLAATNTGGNMAFYLPANQPATWRIDCVFAYSQATGAADSFGVTFSNAPTNTMLWGLMATNATAFASLTPVNITGTSNTTIVTGTPAVTTVLGAHIQGYVEMPSTTTPTQVLWTITQGTAANVVVIKRDSGCTWHSMQ